MKNYKWGVELEMCVPFQKSQEFAEKIRGLNMDVSGDGSIMALSYMTGIEIKTRPLTFQKMSDLIPRMSAVCEEYGATVNKSTGFHIHTSNSGFYGMKRLRHILLTWIAIEDVLFATQPESRLANRYCQRRLYDLVKKNGLPKLPAKKDELVHYLGQEDRYYALNIASLNKHGTLEVRLHSGTTDGEKIIMWMSLMRAIYDFALCTWDAKAVRAMYETPTSEEKVAQVWEMIHLDERVRSFYNKRMQKFLIPRLLEQQKAAQQVMQMNVTWQRVHDRMEEIREEFSNLDEKRNRLMATVSGRGQ